MMSQFFIKSSHYQLVSSRPWADFNFNTWAGGTAMDRHAHAFLQTIHVLEGEFEVDWGKGWRRLGPGDVHVLPPGATHRLRTPTGHRQFGLNFSTEPDERGLLTVLLETFATPMVMTMSFRQLWELHLGDPGAKGTPGRLRQLHALEDYSISLVESATGRQEIPMAGKLVEFLKEHLGGPLSVPKAAEALKTSRATLQRLCRRRFGCGVGHLHERLRLESAAAMLIREELPVGEVADRYGYGDIYRFSRAFKRVHDLSPLAFRRQASARRM